MRAALTTLTVVLQLEVEACGTQIDIESQLPGRWQLIYTTALDVVRCGIRNLSSDCNT